MPYTIQLPKPSSQLISLVKEVALNRPINLSSKNWHDSIQQHKVNCAAGDFFTDNTVTYEGKQEFQSFFKYQLIPVIGVIHNTASPILAAYPPHTDRMRTLSVNYYIELGGDHVNTVYYANYDSIDDKKGGNVVAYDNLQPSHEYQFTTDTWYLLNSRQYHSVENIQTTRILLGLSFFNITESQLLESIDGSYQRFE